MPRYTIEDAKALHAAASNFVAACQMWAEAEKELRVFLPTVSAEDLLTAAIELKSSKDIGPAIELLEMLGDQPLSDNKSSPKAPSSELPEPEPESLSSRVLNAVLQNPGLNRKELASMVGVTPGTMSRILGDLMRTGYVWKEAKRTEGSRFGRPVNRWFATGDAPSQKDESTGIEVCPLEEDEASEADRLLSELGVNPEILKDAPQE